jgi:hypothetical protein
MRGLSDEDIQALADALEPLLSEKIVEGFEERVTGKLYKAAGQWMFGLLWKSAVTALFAFAAFTYGKNNA